MDISFYTAGVGAKAQQTRLDVIGNNMSNANTVGYKSQNAAFVDLLYSNMREPAGANTQLKVGAGARIEKTDVNYNSGGLQSTDNPTDYTIIGDGFFAVQNPSTNQIYYTRDGSFKHSLFRDGEFYLVNGSGELVLDENFERIKVDLSGSEESKQKDPKKPAVFDFEVKDGMLLVGNNLFLPREKNGAPTLRKDAKIQTGALETSNVEVSTEMVKLIETQRAYSMNLKMVQTSGEIEEIINNLR
ncbi:MAG: flagellar hook-basal body protein [Aminipila sp.]